MAKREFLDNVRVGRNLFAHPNVSTDNQSQDPHQLARMLARAAIWLTPKSVSGFDVTDFEELGPARQRELSEAIQEFGAIATQVPPTKPATDAQYAAAASALNKILGILEPYLPTREESLQIQSALQKVNFPSAVVNWDYELGSDADGVPALWVTAFVDESSFDSNQFGRLALELTMLIRRALTGLGITRWPYIRLRTVAEHFAM